MRFAIVGSILGGCVVGVLTGLIMSPYSHSDTPTVSIVLISALLGTFIISKVIDISKRNTP